MQNDGEFSEPFEVTNGSNMGLRCSALCVLPCSWMTFQDSDTGFPIKYHSDGNIFNL